jgi:hypothetical protein
LSHLLMRRCITQACHGWGGVGKGSRYRVGPDVPKAKR